MFRSVSLMAGSAIGSVEVVDLIPANTSKFEILKLALQAVIAIVGIIKIRKAKKSEYNK